MNICGYGSVPAGCGVTMSKKQFGPRAGIAWRVSKTFVVRAGYGITNDPYSLDRPFKYNYPTLLIATYDAPNSYSWATTLQQGIPPVQLPDFGNGIIPLPAAYTTATLNLHEYKRGYIQSWNFTLQKELGFGLTAQAGYIATRSTDMQIGVNINAGQIPGAGTNGQPLKSALRADSRHHALRTRRHQPLRCAPGPAGAALPQGRPLRRQLHLVQSHWDRSQ